jgi:hypothetical protein
VDVPKEEGPWKSPQEDGRILFWRDGIDLLETRSWNEVVRNREFWREEIGEAVKRQRAEAP